MVRLVNILNYFIIIFLLKKFSLFIDQYNMLLICTQSIIISLIPTFNFGLKIKGKG